MIVWSDFILLSSTSADACGRLCIFLLVHWHAQSSWDGGKKVWIFFAELLSDRSLHEVTLLHTSPHWPCLSCVCTVQKNCGQQFLGLEWSEAMPLGFRWILSSLSPLSVIPFPETVFVIHPQSSLRLAVFVLTDSGKKRLAACKEHAHTNHYHGNDPDLNYYRLQSVTLDPSKSLKILDIRYASCFSVNMNCRWREKWQEEQENLERNRECQWASLFFYLSSKDVRNARKNCSFSLHSLGRRSLSIFSLCVCVSLSLPLCLSVSFF